MPINRKYKHSIAYQFKGFMVQCFNEMPRVKDKSNSFYRRQRFVPFTKCFNGIERKYIKDEYLHRQDVLEYVLCKVLNMTYYELSEPTACKAILEEYKEYNDPVRLFADEILPQAQWDLLPFQLLYEMYTEWFKQNMPSGKIQNKPTFINDLITVIKDNDIWECEDKSRQYRGAQKMINCEPLLGKYNLTKWMNPTYSNKGNVDMVYKCTPQQGQFTYEQYRGLIRKQSNTIKASANSNSDTDDEENT